MGKAYSDYTFSDVQRLDFAFLVKDKPEDIQEAQKGAFNYILMMAGELGLSAMNWKPMEIFDVGTGKDLITDRTVINKRLFELRNKGSELPDDSVLSSLPERLEAAKDTILEATKRDYSAELRTLTSNESERLATIADYERHIRDKFSSLAGIRNKITDIRKLMDTNAVDEYIIKQIVAIESTGQYKFLGYSNRKIHFGMTQPSILSYENDSDGVHIEDLNMGYYGLTFSLDSDYVTGFCGPYTIAAKGHFATSRHPHISSDGESYKYVPKCPEQASVCWGNMNSKVKELLESKDWVAVAKLYVTLLNEYFPDNPYQSLGWYADKVEDAAAKGEMVRRGMKEDAADYWSVVDLKAPSEGDVWAPKEVTWNTTEPLEIGDSVLAWNNEQSNGMSEGNFGVIISMELGNQECEVTGSNIRYKMSRPYNIAEFSSNSGTAWSHRGEIEKIPSIREHMLKKLEANDSTVLASLRDPSYKDRVIAKLKDKTQLFIGERAYKIDSRIHDQYIRTITRFDTSRYRYARHEENARRIQDENTMQFHKMVGTEDMCETIGEYIEYLDSIGCEFVRGEDSTAYDCDACDSRYYDLDLAEDCCADTVTESTQKVRNHARRRNSDAPF